jgi:hypothetical protein
MKVAILLPGQPRFTPGFDDFLSKLKGYTTADWFVYFTNNNVNLVNNKPWATIPSEWENFKQEWGQQQVQSMLPPNNFVRYFEISDADQQEFFEPKNVFQVGHTQYVFKMFYNLYRADQARQNYETDNNFQYDLVIRTRPELGPHSDIDLSKLDIQENQIIMPNNDWHGDPSANDQFAMGKSKAMSVYGNLYSCLKEYNDNGIKFHPETLVGHNLQKNNVTTMQGGFDAYLNR